MVGLLRIFGMLFLGFSALQAGHVLFISLEHFYPEGFEKQSTMYVLGYIDRLAVVPASLYLLLVL